MIKHTNSKSGFTLIEVIAVLVLLGILAAVAVPKYIDLTKAAEERAIDAGIAELNGRENLVWGKAMLESGGDIGTADTFSEMDFNLGDRYEWIAGPTENSGTLKFGSAKVVLARSTASTESPAHWTRTTTEPTPPTTP